MPVSALKLRMRWLALAALAIAAMLGAACGADTPVAAERLIITVVSLPGQPAGALGEIEVHLFHDWEGGEGEYLEPWLVGAAEGSPNFAFDLTETVKSLPDTTIDLVVYAYNEEGQVHAAARGSFPSSLRGMKQLALHGLSNTCDEDKDGLLDCEVANCCVFDGEDLWRDDPCPDTADEACQTDRLDCDGLQDTNGIEVGATCKPGVCASGTVECYVGLEGLEAICSSLKLDPLEGGPAAEETCDTLDNDCDGLTDEDFEDEIGEVCPGVGACGDGVKECSTSGLVCSTTDPSGSAYDGIDEACNAEDDDCDGTIDEGFAPNTDGDELPDCSDGDDDDDGVPDDVDDCPLEKEDVDEFEDDDGCPDPDNDGDSVNDEFDNCPDVANTDQLDTDLVDGVETDGGDVCDDDDDNDGVNDGGDNCPLVKNGADQDNQANYDEAKEKEAGSEELGDACDPDDDNDGSPDTEDCEPLDDEVYPGNDEVCDGKDNDCTAGNGEEANSLCADIDNPCDLSTCVGAAGCKTEVLVDDESCDDDKWCTYPDKCNAEGVCTGEINLECVDGNPCTEDICIENKPFVADWECEHPPLAGPCDDGDACTENDACSNGDCEPGDDVECDDEAQCTIDSCDSESGCVHDAEAALDKVCDDGNACTGVWDVQGQVFTDHCAWSEATLCQAGPAAGEPCVDEADCDGQPCEPYPVVDCLGEEIVCDDENPCTDNYCDGLDGCEYPINEDSCEDGDACTEADQCQDGECISGDGLNCDDGNECTLDQCDGDDGCVHEANPGFPCDDENACTGYWQPDGAPYKDYCEIEPLTGSGVCLSDGDPSPGDDDPCTVDEDCLSFDENVAIQFCQDVTETAVCAGPEIACDDGNECTAEYCSTLDGCLTDVNVGAECDDGDPCTVGDTCETDGECAQGAQIDCDDLNPCTTDSCDALSGDCVHVNNSVTCSDDNACTENDVCADGSCIGDDVDCDGDNTVCLEGICTETECSPGEPFCGPVSLGQTSTPFVFICGDDGLKPDLTQTDPTHDCDLAPCLAPAGGSDNPTDYCAESCTEAYAPLLGEACDGTDVGTLCMGIWECADVAPYDPPSCSEGMGDWETHTDIGETPVGGIGPMTTAVALHDMMAYVGVHNPKTPGCELQVYDLPAEEGDTYVSSFLYLADYVVDMVVARDQELAFLIVLLSDGTAYIYDIGETADPPAFVRTITADDMLKATSTGEKFEMVRAAHGITVFGFRGGSADGFMAFYSYYLDGTHASVPEYLFPYVGTTSNDLIDLDGASGVVSFSVTMLTSTPDGSCELITGEGFEDGFTDGLYVTTPEGITTSSCFDTPASQGVPAAIALDDSGLTGLVVGYGTVERLECDYELQSTKYSCVVAQSWSDPADDAHERRGVHIDDFGISGGQTAYVLSRAKSVGEPLAGETLTIERLNLNMDFDTQVFSAPSDLLIDNQTVEFTGMGTQISGWTSDNVDLMGATTQIAVAAEVYGLHSYEYDSVVAGASAPVEGATLLSTTTGDIQAIDAAQGWVYIAAGASGLLMVDATGDLAGETGTVILSDVDVHDVHVLEDKIVQLVEGGPIANKNIALVATGESLRAYDVQSPTSPALLWDTATMGVNFSDMDAEGIAVELPHIYLRTALGLRVIEVDESNYATEPTNKNVFLPIQDIEDILVSKGRLFILASDQIYSYDVGGWNNAGIPSAPVQMGSTVNVPVGAGAVALDLDILPDLGAGKNDRLLVAAGSGGLYATVLGSDPPSALAQMYEGVGATNLTHVLGSSVTNANCYSPCGGSPAMYLVSEMPEVDYSISQLLRADGDTVFQWETQAFGSPAAIAFDDGKLYAISKAGDLRVIEVSCP